MTPEQAWWFETLMSGILPDRPHGVSERRVCSRDELFARYVQHAQLQGVKYRSIETKLGKFLSKQLGAKLRTTRLTVGTRQVRCYLLPPLKDCRTLFSEALGQPVDWGSPEWESEKWQQEASFGDALRLVRSNLTQPV